MSSSGVSVVPCHVDSHSIGIGNDNGNGNGNDNDNHRDAGGSHAR
jgi:hypothetical protein